MNCIFLCRIWKIEDIQQLKLFPVPCSLFPAFNELHFSLSDLEN
ncbi:MAG: hypothetical protein ACK5S7_22165 [Dolichospermum sp.]